MVDDQEFLTISEAARYVGVSAATLRRWDTAGTLQAVRRPGSTYRHYRTADLERFRLEYGVASAGAEPSSRLFSTTDARIVGNPQLREPQQAAFDAAVRHFEDNSDPAIIQLPVGCGKTGVAALLPFALAEKRVLVVAPNTLIREGLYADLNISNANCFWKRTGVLQDFSTGPFAALVDGPNANLDDCINSHIVVANVQQLAGRADRWLSQFPADFFDLVIVDEGHHIAAESWQRVVRAFPLAKFVSLTATPFRSDNRDLLGKLIYSYSFTRAMINGYIKQITSASARPAEITFHAKDEDATYTLDQVLELKEEAWFRRGVALSEQCNRHIAEKAYEKLQVLRSATGFPHQIAAAAMSIDHAHQIQQIFEEMTLQAATIHSGMSDDARAAVLAKLRNNQLDVIVQVAMLGEGFDHPPLSVAAIFRPYRSLAPYIQFVGRIMRTVEINAPTHPNNQGFIVSHVGLNNEEQWDDFRELDDPDKKLVQSWAGARGTSVSIDGSGSGRDPDLRFDDPTARDEVVSHFISQSYLDPDDNRVIDELLDAKGPGGFTFRELGITPEQLRLQYASRVTTEEAPAAPTPVQPQRRRQTLRSRLNSRSKSVHQRILTDLGLARAGFDIARSRVKGGRGNNADALFAILNAEINSYCGQPAGSRETWTEDQVELAYESLDQIGDEVASRLRKALGRN